MRQSIRLLALAAGDLTRFCKMKTLLILVSVLLCISVGKSNSVTV